MFPVVTIPHFYSAHSPYSTWSRANKQSKYSAQTFNFSQSPKIKLTYNWILHLPPASAPSLSIFLLISLHLQTLENNKNLKKFLFPQINSHHTHSFWLLLQNYTAAEVTHAKAHLMFYFIWPISFWHYYSPTISVKLFSLASHEFTYLCSSPIMNITTPLRILSRSLSFCILNTFWCSHSFVGQPLTPDAVFEWNYLFLWVPVYGWLPGLYPLSSVIHSLLCIS